jgi:DNA-binding response OmpR family regulator
MVKLLRTLVVDDEERIRFFLKETLHRAGYEVTTAASGEAALELLKEEETAFDVAILDLRLGGRIDGQRVLEAIRWRFPGTVVLMLTAHGTLDNAMDAIQEGVDGYMLKPVEASEVRQAVRTALARRERQAQVQLEEEDARAHLECGPFVVDLESHRVTRDGEALELTPSEFKLLLHFIQNEGVVLAPPELVALVRQYKPEHLREARQIIRWYIHSLRQKIEPCPSEPCHILNVRGVGYRFAS